MKKVKADYSVESVFNHVVRLFEKDPFVKVEMSSSAEHTQNPSPVSSKGSLGYKIIERTIREVFSGTVVVPSLVVVGTDSRHFSDLAEGIYRFGPFVLDSEDLRRIHGTNERVSVEGFADAVHFYIRLIENL